MDEKKLFWEHAPNENERLLINTKPDGTLVIHVWADLATASVAISMNAEKTLLEMLKQRANKE